MKVWCVALNTYRSLLRSRGLTAFLTLFVVSFLASASTWYFTMRLKQVGASEQSRLLFAQMLEGQFRLYAFLAFLLAALAGAYALPNEIRTGTILPTLARALPRSHFLLGLFLGMNLLLASYMVLGTLASAALILWSGMSAGPYMLWGIVYVVLTANIVAALAFFFAARVSPLLALIAAVFVLQLSQISKLVKLFSQEWGQRVEQAVNYLLPAWDLLGFSEYLRLTRAPVERTAEFHLVGIAHGIDYVAILFLLAVVAFRRRGLLPPS